ncbi:NAD(P)-binding domain-containing protein [Candidatus Pelagibacter sp.]|nr:NAD(P)-binding domain-containing protein [Candidatus Pelagibacter sp.]MDC0518908.1 NAD(P)-binding domain-containing protein [Candidatus Pelagibacter sp.]
MIKYIFIIFFIPSIVFAEIENARDLMEAGKFKEAMEELMPAARSGNADAEELIGRLGVGLDNIDTEFCKTKNIHVQPATGMNADSVAEYVVSSSMSLIKKIPILHNGTIKGNWPRTTIKSAEINGKCIGVVGFGTIGRKVANYSLKNGLNVLAYDPYIKELGDNEKDYRLSSLEDILQNADIVSLHLPLTEETKNLINKSSFSKMQKQPIIINTSRGSVVNENDLIEAYNQNLISGFALDVFENEPVTSDLYEKIKPDMNCILTPHISGVTTESNIRVSNFIVKKTIEFFK